MNLLEVGDKVRVFSSYEIEECMAVGIDVYHMHWYAGELGFSATITHVDRRPRTDNCVDVMVDNKWTLPEELVELI